MNEKKGRRWYLVQGEIHYRWPSLRMAGLSLEVRTPDILATILSEHLGFSPKRAVAEAQIFWNELEERFRRAA
jgi:hypothetical protein